MSSMSYSKTITNACIFPNKSAIIAISTAIKEHEVLDMTDTADDFSERLRTLRKQKKLSQTELGKLASLHYTHIGRFERGISRPGSDSLKRLADALDISSDYLLEGTVDDVAKAKFEDRELLRQFQEVEHLPEEDKTVIKKLLDAFLTKKHLQSLIR